MIPKMAALKRPRARRVKRFGENRILASNKFIPLDGHKLLERISEVWKIPEKSIRPYSRRARFSESDPNRSAHYAFGKHLIVEQSAVGQDTRSHENVHAAHFLVAPQKERAMVLSLKGGSKVERFVRKSELAAALAAPEREHSVNQANERVIINGLLPRAIANIFGIGLGNASAGVLPSLLLAQGVEIKLSSKSLKTLYLRHGLDSLLLFFASPPKVFGYLEMQMWARKMIRRGFLSPSGGLTPEGVNFLRKVLPKEEIIDRAKKDGIRRHLSDFNRNI